MLEIAELRAYYGSKQIIDSVSAVFASRGITAIIGPSGCGKTTLLRCLNGMLMEYGGRYTGRILLDGQDIKTYDMSKLRRHVGMVFQQPTVFPLSVRDNLSYGPRYFGVNDKKVLDELTADVLAKTGLTAELADRLNDSALELSGGQQQRLCIARSLSVQPQMLLLDEPCSALDIKNCAKIEGLLCELASEIGIVIVTHNLQQARRIADTVIFMLDGRLVEMGTELFTAPQDKRTQEYIAGAFG